MMYERSTAMLVFEVVNQRIFPHIYREKYFYNWQNKLRVEILVGIWYEGNEHVDWIVKY